MTEIFVQVNTASQRGRSRPIGYHIRPFGCWEWSGAVVNGYGQCFDGGRNRPAHRVVYEQVKGPIPEGLQLDHLCRNRKCVNPDHLEAVTRKENILRGVCPTAQNARKTHCKHGHEFTPENTHLRRRVEGTRVRWLRRCRVCDRMHLRARWILEGY